MKTRKHGQWRSLIRLRNLPGSKILPVFIPACAIGSKLLEHAPQEVQLTVVEPPIILELGLPFSWVMLFGAAVCCLFGQVILYVFCPEFLLRHRNFTDFVSHGGRATDLRFEIYRVPCDAKHSRISPQLVKEYIESEMGRSDASKSDISERFMQEESPSKSKHTAEGFIAPFDQEKLALSFRFTSELYDKRAPIA